MMRLIAIALLALFASQVDAAESTRVLIVVGPSNHAAGSHEVAAGGRLMEHAVEHMINVPGVEADVVYEWPRDQALREAASTVVFIGDTFPANRFPDPKRNLAELAEMMDRGCGIVCVHYATGLLGEDVAPNGDHPLLRWLGGYFANRSCPHHQSIARVYTSATIEPGAPSHPVSRGWRSFTVHDEPYINNYFGLEGYFGLDGKKLAPTATALASSMLPPEAPKRETVAWSVERKDGGRGFGIVMPHFYKNWGNADLRRFILNGIVWTAKLDVPAEGVQTASPDLEKFSPESVEFVPRSRPRQAPLYFGHDAQKLRLRLRPHRPERRPRSWSQRSHWPRDHRLRTQRSVKPGAGVFPTGQRRCAGRLRYLEAAARNRFGQSERCRRQYSRTDPRLRRPARAR